MSNDYYFRKWRNTLQRLEMVVELDLEYQKTNAHEKHLCEEVHHLSGVLGQYMAIYGDALECHRQNLQVQKTSYIMEIITAVVSRMLELKHDLKKFENSNYQFFGTGIIQARLTTYDIEMLDIPQKVKRSEAVQYMIDNAMIKAREIIKSNLRKDAEHEQMAEEVTIKTLNWWETDETEEIIEASVKVEAQLSGETLNKRAMLMLIQAHEKTRQVIAWKRHREYKRVVWEKKTKRNTTRTRPNRIASKKRQTYSESFKNKRAGVYKKYLEEWKSSCDDLKEKFLEQKGDSQKEDYCDYIRDWFRQWFNEVQFIHAIPKPKQGGLASILKDEILKPSEWIEEYKKYLEDKKVNKNKTALQKKYEKMETKREKMLKQKQELIKKKMEATFLEKLKKNPNLHPGFDYPPSKKIEHLIQAIENYKKDWDDLDSTDSIEVKFKSVKALDMANSCVQAKLQVLGAAEEHMKNEFKILNTALKKDYEINNEKIPKYIKKSLKRKRKRKVKANASEIFAEKLENLAIHGFLTEYPRLKFEDFIGDPNFAGEDLRCQYQQAFPHHGDIRRMWWDRCREMTHELHKILLIGPKGSGKTRLAHIMASVNDAVLFVIDPNNISSDFLTPVYLQEVVDSIATCAKAVQPSVIYIKHVQRLFYSKVPAEEKYMNLELMKRYFIKKLFKKMNNTDKITVIGSCLDPWTTNAKKILKQFNSVVLLPNTSYSVVLQLLQDWVFNNTIIPKDLNVSSLAHVLQGYNFGYLKNALNSFLTPQQVIRIAARGLFPQEIYDYIIQDDTQNAAKYERYLKWYTDKTTWGIKEKKYLEERKEFQELVKKFAEKTEKKSKAVSRSNNSSGEDKDDSESE